MSNTTHTVENGKFSVIVYNTTVLTINQDRITLNSGGYRTNLTKNRINKYLPDDYRLYQENHTWYVETPKGKVEFSDNMVIKMD